MSVDVNEISLTVEQRQRLATLCKRMGKSPGELLDQLLQQYPMPVADVNGQDKPRTLYDAFAEDGSIGIVKDSPTDVSSNPKYMEGFGRSDH